MRRLAILAAKSLEHQNAKMEKAGSINISHGIEVGTSSAVAVDGDSESLKKLLDRLIGTSLKLESKLQCELNGNPCVDGETEEENRNIKTLDSRDKNWISLSELIVNSTQDFLENEHSMVAAVLQLCDAARCSSGLRKAAFIDYLVSGMNGKFNYEECMDLLEVQCLLDLFFELSSGLSY